MRRRCPSHKLDCRQLTQRGIAGVFDLSNKPILGVLDCFGLVAFSKGKPKSFPEPVVRAAEVLGCW